MTPNKADIFEGRSLRIYFAESVGVITNNKIFSF